MRVLQVDTGLGPTALLGISMWKELVLLILFLKLVTVKHGHLTVSSLDVLVIIFIVFLAIYVLISDSITLAVYDFRGTIEPFAFYFIAKNLPMQNGRAGKLLKWI